MTRRVMCYTGKGECPWSPTGHLQAEWYDPYLEANLLGSQSPSFSSLAILLMESNQRVRARIEGAKRMEQARRWLCQDED